MQYGSVESICFVREREFEFREAILKLLNTPLQLSSFLFHSIQRAWKFVLFGKRHDLEPMLSGFESWTRIVRNYNYSCARF